MKKRKIGTGLILLVAVFLVLINIFENYSVGTTFYKIDIGEGKSPQNKLRIIQISDVHMIRSENQGKKIYQKVLDSEPDIIAITGDLVDTEKYKEESLRQLTIEFCKDLCTIAPVYYVYGNHEIMLLDDPEKNSFKTELEMAGVVLFNNKSEYITVNGNDYTFLGVQDPATLYKDPKYAHGNKTKDILSDLTEDLEDKGIKILLAHRPELFDTYADEFDIDLSITGHAHGGQFRIPFTNIGLYAPSQGFLPRYTSGIYESSGNYMVVSRGIGNSRFPFRIFNTPEIVVIDLQ